MRRLFIVIISLALLFLAMEYAMPKYKGPISDHFDGVRFFNPNKADQAPRSLINFLKWRFASKKTAWPLHRDNRFVPQIQNRVLGDELKVTFVGHATVLLQTQGLNILTDPIWSERASPVQWAGPKRVHEPGIAFEALPPIDLVLISHDHYDQLDLPTLKRLEARFHPRFIVGLGNEGLLKKALGKTATINSLDWWQTQAINSNVDLMFVPALHWSKRDLFDTNKTLWGGFLLKLPKGNVYFAGDTGFGDGRVFEEIARTGPIRLALLPIGAYEPRWFMRYSHVNPAESVKIFKILKPQYAMAIHFGTFQLTNEGIDEPLQALDQALQENHLTDQPFRVLGVGEDWWVS